MEELVHMDIDIQGDDGPNKPTEIEDEEEATQKVPQNKSKRKQVAKKYSQRAECSNIL